MRGNNMLLKRMVRPLQDSICYQQAASRHKHGNTTDNSLDNKNYNKDDFFNFSALNCLFSFLR